MADDFYINRGYYFEPSSNVALPKIAVGRSATSAKRLWKDHEHVKITSALDKMKSQADDGPELYVPKFPRPFRTNPVHMIPMYKVLHAPSPFGTPRHNVKELYATATYLTNAVKNVDGNSSYKNLKAMHKIQKETLAPRPQTERVETGQRLIWQSSSSVTPTYTPRRLEPLVASRKSTGERTLQTSLTSKGKYTNSPRESEDIDTREVSIHVPQVRRQKTFLEKYGRGRFDSIDFGAVLLTKENVSHLENETEERDKEVMNAQDNDSDSTRMLIGAFITETETEENTRPEMKEVVVSGDDYRKMESREAIKNDVSDNGNPIIEKSATDEQNEPDMQQENRPDLPKSEDERQQSRDKESEQTRVKRDDDGSDCKDENNDDIRGNPGDNQTEESPPTEVVETKENMQNVENGDANKLEQKAEPVVEVSSQSMNEVAASNEEPVSCGNVNNDTERPGESGKETKCDVGPETAIDQSLDDNQKDHIIQERGSADSGFEDKPKSNPISRNVDLPVENANKENIADENENKPNTNQDSQSESGDTRPNTH